MIVTWSVSFGLGKTGRERLWTLVQAKGESVLVDSDACFLAAW